MFTSFFSREPEMLWKHYLVALSLMMAIVLSSHVLEYHALKNGEHDAALINASGKQRMMSQQIIIYAKAHAENPDAVSAFALKEKIDTFESAHEVLLQEAIEKSVLKSVYLTGQTPLDPLVRDFIACARYVQNDPSTALHHLSMLETKGSGKVLRRLDDAVTAFELLAKSNAQRMHYLQEVTLILAVFVLLLEVLFIFLPAQRVVRTSIAQLRDEVEHHAATNQRLSNFINIASDLYWETDLKERITFVEGRFLELLKGGRDTLVGCNYTDLAEMTDDQALLMINALANREAYRGIRAQFVDIDGVAYVLELSGMPRYNKDGKLVGYLGTADNVTDSVNLLGEVTRQALTDPLTNVANIRAFEADLQAELRDASVLRPVCLLALDLDDFKPINDTYGHGAGDNVIKIIAQRIQSQLRADSWVARTGGDEFCVVCPNVDAVTVSRSLAQRLIEAVCEPVQIGKNVDVRVGVSIGVAEAPEHAKSVEALRKAADTALYSAKSAGKNQVHITTELGDVLALHSTAPPPDSDDDVEGTPLSQFI